MEPMLGLPNRIDAEFCSNQCQHLSVKLPSILPRCTRFDTSLSMSFAICSNSAFDVIFVRCRSCITEQPISQEQEVEGSFDVNQN